MRAQAFVHVEREGARTVVRELRSQAPLALLPQRTAVRADDRPVVVHVVGSATTPVGGDATDLHIRVGPGASLVVRGTAATVALPGHRGGGSRASVHIEVAEGGFAEYRPEPVVLSARAEHSAELRVDLAADARERTRETLVLGRTGEEPGSVRTATHVVRGGAPVLRQRLDLGSAGLRASPGYLAGARVVATELVLDPPESAAGRGQGGAGRGQGGAAAMVGTEGAAGAPSRGGAACAPGDRGAAERAAGAPGAAETAAGRADRVRARDPGPDAAVSGQWWSCSPLVGGGAVATALAADAVTAEARLAEALAAGGRPAG